MTNSTSLDLWSSVSGRGPRCVLVHGGLGLDHTYFRPLVNDLADVLEVVVYDQRGCGRSPDPADWSTADFTQWVDDLAAVIVAQGPEPVIVLGHSFGGMVAIAHALAHPEQVSGLVLCGAYPVFDYAEQAVGNAIARCTDAQRDALLAGLSAPFADDATFARFCEVVLPIYFHAPTAAQLEAFSGMQARAAAMNCTQQRWNPVFDFTPQLGALRMPTLVLSGADDWIVPLECGPERLAAGIPDATRVDFAYSGHFPFLEEPEAFRTALVGWLSARGLLPAVAGRA